MIEPYQGRVYDPCCGSGGMFVQSEKFVEAHGGRLDDISIFGQESNPTTWRLAKMNLAIRGIEANLGPQHADTFHRDLHPDLKADFVLANPPFNMSDWGGDDSATTSAGSSACRRRATPTSPGCSTSSTTSRRRASPASCSPTARCRSQQSGEGEIRKAIVEADLVDCMVALPGQLFYGTQIPVCLWFLARDKSGRRPAARSRCGRGRARRSSSTPASSARWSSRTHRELTDEEIARIVGTYHAWRGEPGAGEYADVPGFCKGATLEEIREHDHVLTPGRYVGAAAEEDDGEPFEEKLARLTADSRSSSPNQTTLERAIGRARSPRRCLSRRVTGSKSSSATAR